MRLAVVQACPLVGFYARPGRGHDSWEMCCSIRRAWANVMNKMNYTGMTDRAKHVIKHASMYPPLFFSMLLVFAQC